MTSVPCYYVCMDHDDLDAEQILENYEKQFAETASAPKIVAAESLMASKLHAVTQELIHIALHGEKEETRLKACLAVQLRVIGPATDKGSNDPADEMFRMLEAKSKRRNKNSS